MSTSNLILVTGAAGRVGNVGRKIVDELVSKGHSVRAMVHSDDERAQSLRQLGVEVICGDLTNPNDVVRALDGCKKAFFGMSVSATYLEASCVFAAAAKEKNDLEILVNISQMTVSQMTLTNMTNSLQQKMHWLAEQVMNWSGVPVVHVRATAFLEHLFFSDWVSKSIEQNGTIRLPFGKAKTSPVATDDVARVIATILEKPNGHAGKVYELTGAKSQDLDAMAKEYEQALGRPVKYVDMPFEQWYQEEFLPKGLPDHVAAHLKEMAKLHAQDRYNRQTEDVEKITGKPATSIKDYVKKNTAIFGHLQ